MDFVSFLIGVIFLCYKHRASVSSWGRTEKHNKDVGGVEDSYHLIWCGCDVVLDLNAANPSFERDARKMGFNPIWEKDHYHLQPLGW